MYDHAGNIEKCGNEECGRHVTVTKDSIRYDGYVFCSLRCRNFYSRFHDSEAVDEEQGIFLFRLEQARRNGSIGGGNR